MVREPGLRDRAVCEVLGVEDGHVGALALAAAPADAQETPEDEVLRSRLHADLHRAVKALPDKQRALVERHYFGDENFDAIAEDIGISKSWASRVHAQAMDALAAELRAKHA